MEVSDEIYETLQKRDTKFDGIYYVGIHTTGIVCFPSCKSRLPKRENVRVFATLAQAIEAGFRPCKRCQPDHPNRLSPDAVIAESLLGLLRERLDEPWTLDLLAKQMNMSPYHLQRTYKRYTGISPAAQLRQMRMKQAKAWLLSGRHSVGEVAVAIGFRSVSHFARVFQSETGMTPTAYQKAQEEGLN